MTSLLFHRLWAMLGGCALIVSLAGCTAQTGSKVEYIGRLDWPPKAHGAGGFSGLEIDLDGSRFFALSDRAELVEGRFIREGQLLVRIEQGAPQSLRDTSGAPLKEWQTDSEGLAIGPNGRLFVSFERQHRVWAYDGPEHPQPLDLPKDFQKFEENAGFEALAIDKLGRLYALPERSGQLTQPFPVWRHENGRWREVFSVSRKGGFLPVGADFGPDGMFYLLEREFSGFSFRSRVRRFAFGEDRVLSEELLLQTPRHKHGNLEGIAVWRDAAGTIRLTMVSDDNFQSFQRSEFVEYRVTE